MPDSPHFDSSQQVTDRLRGTGHAPSPRIAGVVHLAERLGKPVLVEGPAGTGTTQPTKSAAESCGPRLIPLQCYEGLDEAKALHEWDYRKQLLHIARTGTAGGDAWRASCSTSTSCSPVRCWKRSAPRNRSCSSSTRSTGSTSRPRHCCWRCCRSIRCPPELGTLRARITPLVFLTSNNSRELSEALKHRCLYLHIGYPTAEHERDIVLAQVSGIEAVLAGRVGQLVRSLRSLELRKKPSVAKTLDWARTLVLLGADDVTTELLADTLPVLLKNESDIALALKEFGE
ncbi:AAA family ATPase [Streptomyces canus]|uniref:AAA family ATPase n=1 Tax=Streptomyces canus TaxID=58343 RepID=UPI003D9A58E9